MSSPKQAISDQHLPLEESFGADLARPAYDDIAELAYQLWECRMRNDADGSAEKDWLEAERQLQDADRRVEE